MARGQHRRPLAGLGLFILIGVLAGCAGLPKPEISAALRDQYHVAEVVVDTPENAELWWGDAERELAAKDGVAFNDSGDGKAISQEEFAALPKTRAYVGKKIAGIVRDGVKAKVDGALHGAKAANLKLQVRKLFIASAAQRVIVGGVHQLIVDAWLADAATGQELTPRQMFSVAVGGGGGVVGVLTDQVINSMMNDPVYRLADQVGLKTRAWLVPNAT